MIKMNRIFIVTFMIFSCNLAQAQWRDTKHHLVLTAMVGARPNFGDLGQVSSYQVIGRGMWYWKRPIAFGAEAGLSGASGQYTNFDAGSVNAFAHLKLPLGFYAEGGLGVTGRVSDGRSYQAANAGTFWSLGYAKSLGKRVAVEVQYRSAPSIQPSSQRNINSGLRLGLSLKI